MRKIWSTKAPAALTTARPRTSNSDRKHLSLHDDMNSLAGRYQRTVRRVIHAQDLVDESPRGVNNGPSPDLEFRSKAPVAPRRYEFPGWALSADGLPGHPCARSGRRKPPRR